jgi:NTE family protein
MRAAIPLLALALAACAGMPDTHPINTRLSAAPAPIPQADLVTDEDAIGLALSGGGARAASFSLGVLQQLRDTKDADGKSLADKLALITAVSGGSITATWFGLHGVEGLDTFRAAALDKDWQAQLHTSFISPQNWDRLLQGGLNGPDKLARWLDTELFADARIGDLRARPLILVNAADLYSGAPFAFAPPWFEAICSELSSVRLADAVAASMSVPVAFRPIVLRSFAGDCPAPLPPWVARAENDRTAPMLLRETARSFRFYREQDRMQYLHLTDGGVTDNFGVSSLVTLRAASGTPHGPFSARDAVKLKRFTFFIVNAERNAEGDWAMKEAGPDGPALIGSVLSIAVNAPKRAAADAFAGTLEKWEQDIIAWRCALSPEEAAQLGAASGWNCRDLDFRLDIISFADVPEPRFDVMGKAATAVSLPGGEIDTLIEGGREAIRRNAEAQKLAQ